MTFFPTQVVEFALNDDTNDADLVHEGRTISDLSADERANYDFALALVIAYDADDEYLRIQAADGVYELSAAYARPLDHSELAELIF